MPPGVKKRILVAVLIALTIGNMMILNVEVILPNFIKDTPWTGKKILTLSDSSLIISIFSIAQLIFAPINGTIKNYLGAKNAIVIGFAILTITTIGLGLISLIHEGSKFYGLALFLRFF